MAQFSVVLIPDEEAGGFTVRVPAIPAIVTEGDDRDHALAMAREAIDLYLETAAAHGWDLPSERLPIEVVSVVVTEPVGATPATA